jgi:hypothetical protein
MTIRALYEDLYQVAEAQERRLESATLHTSQPDDYQRWYRKRTSRNQLACDCLWFQRGQGLTGHQ